MMLSKVHYIYKPVILVMGMQKEVIEVSFGSPLILENQSLANIVLLVLFFSFLFTYSCSC